MEDVLTYATNEYDTYCCKTYNKTTFKLKSQEQAGFRLYVK